jgi:CSLREA domain-containing protein
LSDIFKEDKNMKRAKRFHMVGLVSLVTLGLLFIQIGFGGAKASAESNVTSAMSNSQSTSKTLTQESGRPWINFRDGVDLATSYSGAAGLAQILERNLAQPLALASADFDEDGVPDLVSGYVGPSGGIVTLHRGNVDSIYPNAPEARNRMGEWGNGRMGDAINGSHSPTLPLSHSPFLPEARIFEVPEAPEFIGTGDFDNDGHWDIVAAARGSEALYLLPGDGRGGFAVAKQIPLPGTVTTLTTGEINRRDGLTDIVVGIIGQDGPQVLVFEWPEGALSRSASWQLALPQEATALALGQLDDSYEMGLAVAAGSELLIVHGRDRKLSLDQIRRAEVLPATIDQRSVPFSITSLALGDFIWDQEHQTDIALLANDGAIHVVTNPNRLAAVSDRQSRSKTASKHLGEWLIETLTTSDQRLATSGQLLCANVSSLPTDDLVVLDQSNHQLHIISDLRPQTKSIRNPQSAILAVNGPPVAVLPMRLNKDALNDLVILKRGSSTPTVALTAPLATFTVNTNDDVDDGTCDATHCSLREAINAANANPGMDEIDFAIPGTGPHTIQPTSDLPTITDPVVIDGYTQPGASPNTNPFGLGTNTVLKIELDLSNPGVRSVYITAGDSCVRGLVFGFFLETGGGNHIEGNFIGTDVTGTTVLMSGEAALIGSSDNCIGGTAPAARNIISGHGDAAVEICCESSMGNLVQGNYIGTKANGTEPLGNFVGVAIFQSNNCIGGTVPGAGNLISGNSLWAVVIDSGSGNMVQGNYIGTDASGNNALPNHSSMFPIHPGDCADFSCGTVAIRGGSDSTVGGTATGARNVISGNNLGFVAYGVQVSFSENNIVQGNYIGTKADGISPLPNNGFGVRVIGASNNTIGGMTQTAGNTIAFNSGLSGQSGGVSVFISTDNVISSNSIFDNTGLGIDLSTPGFGVTPNDPGDGDSGANNLQNFPELTVVCTGGGMTHVEGTIDSLPGNSAYPITIEFFGNTSCDLSGFGEGRTFLGSITVTGSGPFMADLPGIADHVTATATDANGNTSEFSECFVRGTDCDRDGVSDAVENGAPNGGDGNKDGIRDSQQANVTSLLNAQDGRYVTLASPDGTSLVDVSAVAPPTTPPVPLPFGVFEFTVQGLTPGGSTTVTVFLPPSPPVGTYYKYGPEPGNATDHWYEFLFDGTTGAEFAGNVVTLHLKDGARGDHDLTADGKIVEPGGPAVQCQPDTTPPTVSCSVAQGVLPTLWPPNHDLVNVGLSVSAADQCDANLTITVMVFGDEDDEEPTGDGTHSPDAKDIAPGTLRVRSERKADADGRVYLIVVKATDDAGNVGLACCTVVVPKSQSQADQNAVNAQAASARSYCLANNGAPPMGYFVIGDGSIIGPKQ